MIVGVGFNIFQMATMLQQLVEKAVDCGQLFLQGRELVHGMTELCRTHQPFGVPGDVLARHAHALLLVHEGSAFAFRSLTNTLCIGQALFVALAYRLESSVEEHRYRGDYDD